MQQALFSPVTLTSGLSSTLLRPDQPIALTLSLWVVLEKPRLVAGYHTFKNVFRLSCFKPIVANVNSVFLLFLGKIFGTGLTQSFWRCNSSFTTKRRVSWLINSSSATSLMDKQQSKSSSCFTCLTLEGVRVSLCWSHLRLPFTSSRPSRKRWIQSQMADCFIVTSPYTLFNIHTISTPVFSDFTKNLMTVHCSLKISGDIFDIRHFTRFTQEQWWEYRW